jgi:hypothetical protein
MHGQALIELRIPVEITTPIFKVLDHEYVPPSTADRKTEGTPPFLLATELSQVKLQASSSRQSAVFRSAVVSDCNSTLAGRIHNCLSTWILVQASLRGRDKGPPTVVTPGVVKHKLAVHTRAMRRQHGLAEGGSKYVGGALRRHAK